MINNEDLKKQNNRLILGNKAISEKLMNITRKKLDLQKENDELKVKLLDLQSEYIELENFHNSEIKELEKENTIKNYQVSRLYLEGYDDAKKETEKEIFELKEQNIKDCESFNKTMKEIKEQWNKEHYQLIKAKEIIRKYYKYNPSCDYSYEDVDKEAEQFLKESE